MFHISHEPTLRQKIAKEYALPTLKERLTKFILMNEMLKHESTTTVKIYNGFSLYSK